MDERTHREYQQMVRLSTPCQTLVQLQCYSSMFRLTLGDCISQKLYSFEVMIDEVAQSSSGIPKGLFVLPCHDRLSDAVQHPTKNNTVNISVKRQSARNALSCSSVMQPDDESIVFDCHSRLSDALQHPAKNKTVDVSVRRQSTRRTFSCLSVLQPNDVSY